MEPPSTTTIVDRRRAALERRRQQMQGATAAVEQTLQTSLRPGLSMLSSMVSTEGLEVPSTPTSLGLDRSRRPSKSSSVSMYIPVKLPSRLREDVGEEKKQVAEKREIEEGGKSSEGLIMEKTEKEQAARTVTSLDEGKQIVQDPLIERRESEKGKKVVSPQKEAISSTITSPPIESPGRKPSMGGSVRPKGHSEQSSSGLLLDEIHGLLEEKITRAVRTEGRSSSPSEGPSEGLTSTRELPIKIVLETSEKTENKSSIAGRGKTNSETLTSYKGPSTSVDGPFLKSDMPTPYTALTPSIKHVEPSEEIEVDTVPHVGRSLYDSSIHFPPSVNHEEVKLMTSEKMRLMENIISESSPVLPPPPCDLELDKDRSMSTPLSYYYGRVCKHPPQLKAKITPKRPAVALPAVSSYTAAHSKAATTIQSWWRGQMTRIWLSAALVARRLHSGGPTVREVEKAKPSSRSMLCPEKRRQFHLRNSRENSERTPSIGPWPRTLVRSLCEFLDALQPMSDDLQPSDLPCFGGTCDTMARVYRRQEVIFSKHPPFAFNVEKRALAQLKKSREAREALMKNIETERERSQVEEIIHW